MGVIYLKMGQIPMSKAALGHATLRDGEGTHPHIFALPEGMDHPPTPAQNRHSVPSAELKVPI
jgi:hypothetical protein